MAEHQPLPELAAALRPRVADIIRAWEAMARRALPAAAGLSSAELRDDLPDVLPRLCDALGAGSAKAYRKLMDRSPSQGVTRFLQHFDVRDLMTADRLLRRAILEHAEAGLVRRMSAEENVGLNAAVDEMFQQSMVAFVGRQSDELRAAEAELKYLSFLSHDLNNHLGSVTLLLQVLRQELAADPAFATRVADIDLAQQSIVETVSGMQRLLQSERLRKGRVEAKSGPVPLHALASDVARQFSGQAGKKGLRLAVEVGPAVVVESDGELIALVLRNLLGNAVKYSERGTVRVAAERGEGGRWRLSVSDEGPGIAPERLGQIFEAFRRGEAHGQQGVGLGLAIASQAARVLGAELTVESELGKGSTFLLSLPPSDPGQ